LNDGSVFSSNWQRAVAPTCNNKKDQRWRQSIQTETIKVWTNGEPAGLLGLKGVRGTAFVNAADTQASRAVSIMMPLRLASWDSDYGLPPIFEMNLPEGALRERLRLAFAKATGTFDDLDLLTIVG
jgi:serine/threonine-protein kinase HipA